MINQAPRCAEDWTVGEWQLTAKVILLLRSNPHRITLEVRRDRSGEMSVFEVKRREELRVKTLR